jgi:hypothetical protein
MILEWRTDPASECGAQPGVTQREYGLLVALPRYRAQLERALLAKGRSLHEWDESDVRARELQRQSCISWASVISESPSRGTSLRTAQRTYSTLTRSRQPS